MVFYSFGDGFYFDGVLFAGVHIFERYLSARSFIIAENGNKPDVDRGGIFKLFSELIGFRVKKNS
jgi:hypothetical protein